MAKLLTALLGVFFFAQAYAQEPLTPTQWQADLQFLQQTVHREYLFLFKKVTAEQFDAEVEKLHEAIPELQPHEIFAGMARIIALFQYGHTSIVPVGEHVQYHAAPVQLYQFSDGMFIQSAHRDYANLLGSKVLKVEGMSVDEALAAIRPLVPAENDQYFKAYGPHLLCVPEALHAQRVTQELKDCVTMTLQIDGKIVEQSFAAVPRHPFPLRYGLVPENDVWREARDDGETPLYLTDLDRIYFLQYLPEQKTLYVRHSQIQDDPQEPIPAFYSRVFQFIEQNDVDKLVLDVRLNGGGNNYKNKPIVTGIIGCEKINQPGKLFVIIGRRTFSACQNLVNELDNYTSAIFVGEPTAENINFYGDNRRVDLPNSKIPVFLSFAWWQDKPQWENAPWLAPDIDAQMSFEDYRSNRDPVLEAALRFSAEGYIPDPISYLTELFLANELDLLRAEARRLIADPRHKSVNFEEEINNAGYQLLGEDQLDAARLVFELNTEFFPDSANTWDSLAESCWKSGQLDKAVEYYNKAIELDPDGQVGQNAREMLQKIKADK